MAKRRNRTSPAGVYPPRTRYQDPRESRRDTEYREPTLVKIEDTTPDMFMVDDEEDLALLTPSDVAGAKGRARDAVPPPPGYRYLPDGRLVPFVRASIPLGDELGQQLFCEILEITGSFRTACDALNIRREQEARAIMNKDVLFAEGVEIAAQRHRESIYAAAMQRAVRGYQSPVIGGKDKDKIVAWETKYSDSLLKLLLCRHFPEFRNADKAAGVTFVKNQVNVGQVNMPDARLMTRAQRDAARLLLGTPPEEVDGQAIVPADGEEETHEVFVDAESTDKKDTN